MSNFFARMAVGVALVGSGASAALALPALTSMREGEFTLAPFSFAKFCVDYPGECPAAVGAARIELTRGRMAELSRINRSVNAAIEPMPDTSAFRYWRLNVASGDCNSFAVQKRHDLIQHGWPAAALALTVAKTISGEGHLVVTVRTDQGDLVLDNLRSTVVSWQKTGYHWIMRQSERDPQYWVELHGGQVGQIYATRSLDDESSVAGVDPQTVDRQDNFARPESRPMARGERSLPVWAATTPTANPPAIQLSVADIADWLDRSRRAAEPIVNGVMAALDPFREVSAPNIQPPAVVDNRLVKLTNPIDPAAFGFI
jgi:predicted transglutaminase-like cysteine proteinase